MNQPRKAPPPAGAGSHARAFVAQLAGVGDVPPDDPHRAAKWFAGLVGVSFTAFLAWSALKGHRRARLEGYRAGRNAAVAHLPPRRKKR